MFLKEIIFRYYELWFSQKYSFNNCQVSGLPWWFFLSFWMFWKSLQLTHCLFGVPLNYCRVISLLNILLNNLYWLKESRLKLYTAKQIYLYRTWKPENAKKSTPEWRFYFVTNANSNDWIWPQWYDTKKKEWNYIDDTLFQGPIVTRHVLISWHVLERHQNSRRC